MSANSIDASDGREKAMSLPPPGISPRGLVQVYTGDGKGKTTAALGLALRAVGHGFKVRVIQFMKGVSYTGELMAVQRLMPGIEIMQFGRDCRRSSAIRQGFTGCQGCGECFVRKGQETDEDRALAALAYATALATLKEGRHDIVILDELNNALHYELVSLEQALELIDARPAHVELIITGRNMPKEILERADLVTEMAMVKHPFEKGIRARRGIEY